MNVLIVIKDTFDTIVQKHCNEVMIKKTKFSLFITLLKK